LNNRDIAETFDTIADMLQIKGESYHRWMAYHRAAETIRELSRDLKAVAAGDGLTSLPGIGDTLAQKIEEMLQTGELEFYQKLQAEVPLGVVSMMRINGVGPKKAALFWQELGITTIDELRTAAEEGKLASLSGMGEKTQQKILKGIEALARQQTGRTPLADAQPIAEKILARLLEMPQVGRGEIAGSIRRARPTIGDVDLLVTGDDGAPIMEAFVNMPEVEQVLVHGDTKTSVQLFSGLQVDLRVLPEAKFGTALQYFTGSQQHNIRVRDLAQAKGYSLNENALVPIDDSGELDWENAVYCATEAEVYEKIGLPCFPPEIRENRGEFEAAQNGTLPRLVTVEDMRGDLHMHTTASDGTLSVRKMAETARERGREYIVITDHSRSLGIANGLSIERLMQQQEEVRRVNDEMGDDFHIFHGTEMDINADGSLDYPDDVLARLDFVIASLHVSLRQDRETITQRVLTAVNNPHVDLIGHPRGQMIGTREPADLDMERVFEAAAKSGVALEINANPIRLDLEAGLAQQAAGMGIPISINTDAHSAHQMDLLSYGVRTARRGWIEPGQVINTWTVDQFLEWVRARR
jgi:DNA polymerase (family 10)